MANLLLMVLVYSQFHSPLVQYLTQAGMPQVAGVGCSAGGDQRPDRGAAAISAAALGCHAWPVRVRLHVGMALFWRPNCSSRWET